MQCLDAIQPKLDEIEAYELHSDKHTARQVLAACKQCQYRFRTDPNTRKQPIPAMSRYSVAPRRGDSRQSVFGTLTQSSASAASTQYDSDGAVILTPAQQRIKERQAELDLFTKLEKQVEQFQAHLDGIAADMGTLAGGGESALRNSLRGEYTINGSDFYTRSIRDCSGELEECIPCYSPCDGWVSLSFQAGLESC